MSRIIVSALPQTQLKSPITPADYPRIFKAFMAEFQPGGQLIHPNTVRLREISPHVYPIEYDLRQQGYRQVIAGLSLVDYKRASDEVAKQNPDFTMETRVTDGADQPIVLYQGIPLVMSR